MKSLVVNETAKQIKESGDENIIETQQIKIDCENITVKEARLSGNSVTLDEMQFRTAIGESLSGNYVFIMTSSGWQINDNTITLSDYGIRLKRDGNIGEKITFTCSDDNIDDTIYSNKITVFQDGTSEYFDYINLICDTPELIFAAKGQRQLNGQTYDLFGGHNIKVEMFFEKKHLNFNVTAATDEYFDTAKVTMIVALKRQR